MNATTCSGHYYLVDIVGKATINRCSGCREFLIVIGTTGFTSTAPTQKEAIKDAFAQRRAA